MILTASRPVIRTLITLLLLLPLLLVSFAGSALAEVVGRLTRVEGGVDIMPGGQLPAQPAREGASVQKGDFVRTKSNARAELTFSDGSVIKIAPRSRIDVSEYSGSDRKLGLPRGKVQAIVVPAASGSAPRTFEIKTPNAIAGVRGTSFYVYHQANITGVAVIEGVVHTASLALPTQGVTLTAGTATTVGRRNAPTPPRPVPERELNRHKDDVTPAATQGTSNGSGGAGSGEQGGTSGSSSSTSANSATGTAPADSNGTTSSSTASSSNTASSSTGNSTLGTNAPLTSDSSSLGSIATPPVDSFDVSQLAQTSAEPKAIVPSSRTAPTAPFVDPPGKPNPTVTPPSTNEIPPSQLNPTPAPEPDPTPTTPPTDPTTPPTVPTTPPTDPTTPPTDPTTPPTDPTTPPTDPTTPPTDPTTPPTDPTTPPADPTTPPTDPTTPPTDPTTPPVDPTTPPVDPTTPPTDPTPTQPQFTSTLGASLMSRGSSIDTSSNLLTIINDGSLPLVFAGTDPIWSGAATATLTGAYPTAPLAQPNHYWFGKLFSDMSPNHTTADGGAYFGYFQGMSLDTTGETNSHVSALYIDPNGRIGIMQSSLSGTISSGALSSSGLVSLTEMTPASPLTPASFSANWWDPQNGIVTELTGPVLTQFGTASPGSTIPNATSTIPGSTSTTVPASTSTTVPASSNAASPPSDSGGFMLDGNFNITGTMTNRGDVVRLAYLNSDPSFGIWTRESFGSFNGNSPLFALISGADWGTFNPDTSFTVHDAIRIVSLGSWQSDSGLTGTADGVWGNLDTGSIKLLTGVLTGSSNSTSSSFGAVTTGAFIDLQRFIANPTAAAGLGFPTLQGPDSFSLSGIGPQGAVSIPNLTFYSRNLDDPISLWVAVNLAGSYSGNLSSQRFSLLNGSSPAGSSIIGSMQITSTSSPTGPGTWLGMIEGLGETGNAFRSEFDGIAAGSFDGTTFSGRAAGLTHPVTYFNTINGGEVRRFLAGSSVLYGSIDGIMGGMSLWNSTTGLNSDFRGIGFFTPNQPITESDFVMKSVITSKDLPSGSAMTADGGAYHGHLVGGVNTIQSGTGTPPVLGVMNALAVDPEGNAGILHGKFEGFIDPVTNVWTVDGSVASTILDLPATGSVTAAGLNSGGVSTVATPFASGGSFFAGTPAPLGFAPDAYSRSFITSSPDWGIGEFGLYAAYSVAPPTGTPWNMDFAISNGPTAEYRMAGVMNGNPWDPALGTLRGDTRAFWHDMQAAQVAATPTTGIFIGETVGTFNPVSLQAMTSGIWVETRKFLDLVLNKPAELTKLNIPSVEVGRADFSGSNAGLSVNINDLRFFTPVTGGRPQLFATDNVNGTYAAPPALGSAVTLTQVANTGVAVSGLAPVFSVNQWDTANGKWAATVFYNGSTGLVAGHGNIQMQGVAAGRSSGGTSGNFTGTAAGIVR